MVSKSLIEKRDAATQGEPTAARRGPPRRRHSMPSSQNTGSLGSRALTQYKSRISLPNNIGEIDLLRRTSPAIKPNCW